MTSKSIMTCFTFCSLCRKLLYFMCSLPSTIALVLQRALARVLVGDEKVEVLESTFSKEFLFNFNDSDRLLSFIFL